MLKILQRRDQIRSGRRKLEEYGVSCVPGMLERLRRRLSRSSAPAVGDPLKSWDVWLSYDFIRSRNDSSICVTDLGTFSSEILPALWRGGFRHLAGLDLNPRLQEMPFSAHIDYRTENFLASSLGDASADIVTAISVIEHGFEPEALLREVARLLRPGGCFLASFDYWPEKIDTSAHRIFGMSWDILSRAQVEDLVSTAARHGLQPLGDMDFGAGEKVIRYDGFDYTFAWLALRKVTTTPAAAT